MSSYAEVSWLVQMRIGLIHAFDEVTDERTRWSVLCTIEFIDHQIDSHADAVIPTSALGQYLAFRPQHHPVAIPDDLTDLT